MKSQTQQELKDMDKLFDKLTVGTTQQVTKVNEAAYSLPIAVHDGTLYKKSDESMRGTNDDTPTVASSGITKDERMKEVGGPRKKKIARVRRRLKKRRAEIRMKRKSIRALLRLQGRTMNNNNVEKSLRRAHRRKMKEDRMKVIQNKRQRKIAMKNLTNSLESFKL